MLYKKTEPGWGPERVKQQENQALRASRRKNGVTHIVAQLKSQGQGKQAQDRAD